jgi:ABC-type tungstate transport system substrate-binding protein
MLVVEDVVAVVLVVVEVVVEVEVEVGVTVRNEMPTVLLGLLLFTLPL